MSTQGTTATRNRTRNAQEKSPLGAASNEFSEGDLGKIQGILFGDQARKTEERIDALELSLLGAIADLKKNMEAKISALSTRLDEETEKLTTADSTLSDKIGDESSARQKAVGQIQKDLTKSTDKLTTSIDAVASTASDQLQTTRKALVTQIEDSTGDLRDKSLSRESMIAMLTSSALQLSKEDS